MSPEVAAILERLALPGAFLLVGLVAGMLLERFQARLRRKAWQKRSRLELASGQGSNGLLKAAWGPRPDQPGRQQDAADQLRVVMGAEFTIQPLLNKSEVRVLKELERFVETCNPRWQVMAQVSMGEILRSKDATAYGCINSKRVDLLLIDEECLPRHAIEYQGTGHHQGSAAARDAVKKEALRRAGIGYHEVVAGHTTPSDLQRLVEKLVTRPPAQLAARP